MSMDLDTQHFGEDGEYGTPRRKGKAVSETSKNVRAGDLSADNIGQQIEVKYDRAGSDVVVIGPLEHFSVGKELTANDLTTREVRVRTIVAGFHLPMLNPDHLVVLTEGVPQGTD